MLICRTLVPTLALLTALLGAEPAVAPAVPASATEATAPDAAMMAKLNALIDTAIAHGLPDGTGAVLLKGKLAVIEDKAQTAANNGQVLRSSGSFGQMGGERIESDQHITTTYDGIHARLKDGSYLINLSYRLPTSAIIAVKADGATAISSADLRARLPAENGPDETLLAEYAKIMSPSQVAGIKAMMRWLWLLKGLNSQGTALTAAVLIRAGVPDAHELIWAEIDQDTEGQFATEVRPLYLSHQDARFGTARLNQAQDRGLEHGQQAELKMPEVTLDEYLRKGLQAWFRQQLGAPAGSLTKAQAIASLSTLLGGTADQTQREELRMFTEFAALPATVAADAALAERLARWAPAELPRGMSSEAFKRMHAAQLSRLGYKPAAGPAITESDRAGLFALLDDQRASAWLDQDPFWGMSGGTPAPRTLGDNALRALASQYGFDPRLLVGRDQFAGWTTSERSATASALQEWFTAHSNEPEAGLLAAVMKVLPAGRAAALISSRPKEEQPALITAVLENWKAAQPTGPDAEGLGEMLALAKDDPTAATVVSAWPVVGDHRLLLAVWHDLHGDGKPLDALIPEILAAAAESAHDKNGLFANRDPNNRGNLFAALAARPTADRLALLKIQLADPVAPSRQAILQAVLSGRWTGGRDAGLWALLGYKRNSVWNALGFSLLADLLANRNPLAPDKVEVQPWGVRCGGLSITVANADEQEQKRFSPAADLRWCDLAAYAVVGNPWEYRDDHGGQPEDLPFNLAAPIAERDAQIAAIRLAIDPVISAACAAAKLPAPTGGAPAPASDKALF